MTMPADLDRVITAALSAEADSLTISEWAPDAVRVRDRERASGQGRPGPARRRSWTALGAAALVVAAATTVTVLAARAPERHVAVSPGTTVTYALASNGWTPGAATMDAAFRGPFHAALVDGHACAWLGNTQQPSLWPAGWRVRFHPTQLIEPNGHVFASEGDALLARGGRIPPGAADAQCGGDTNAAASLTQLELVAEPHASDTPAVSPSSSTAPTTTRGLVPPDTTATETARGCSPYKAPIVTLTIDPDGMRPDCAIVGSTQRLRLVNATNAYHQRGVTVTVNFAGLPPRTLKIGQATTYDMPFGTYLAPGQHYVQVSNFGSSNFPVWLK
jgi:hypothetical protein